MSNSLLYQLIAGEGNLIILTGGMCGGKTNTLNYLTSSSKYSPTETLIIKPKIDARFGEGNISRTGSTNSEVISIDSFLEGESLDNVIKRNINFERGIIGLDEVTLYKDNEQIYHSIRNLVDQGYNVIAAGLQLDWRGQPFKVIRDLMPYANQIQVSHGICYMDECMNFGERSLKLINEKPADLLNERLIEVGSEKGTQIRYYPCCTKHWNLAYDHK